MNHEREMKIYNMITPSMESFMEVHILRTVNNAITCANDDGSQKTCMINGTERARTPSQTINHAFRQHINETIEYNERDFMSSFFPAIFEEALKNLDKDDEYRKAAWNKLKKEYFKEAKLNDNLSLNTGDFFSIPEVNQIAKSFTEIFASTDDTDDKTKTKKFDKVFHEELDKCRHSMLLYLFGRSNISKVFTKMDSAIVNAHAFSVNEYMPSLDFYTTQEEMYEQDYATHLEDREISSNVFYQYYGVSTRQLIENRLRFVENLDNEEEVKKALKEVADILADTFWGYLEVFTNTGKSRRFSSDYPCTVYTTISKGRIQPRTLEGAFNKPINENIEEKATKALVKSANDAVYGPMSMAEYTNRFYTSKYKNKPKGATVLSLQQTKEEIRRTFYERFGIKD